MNLFLTFDDMHAFRGKIFGLEATFIKPSSRRGGTSTVSDDGDVLLEEESTSRA